MKTTIWFDDGYESVFKIGYPMLREYGLKGKVAVITGRVASLLARKVFPLMTIEQLKILIDDGWEIASHSVNHFSCFLEGYHFADISLERTECEARESKEWIIKNLGVIPTKFVAPHAVLRKAQIPVVKKYYSYIRPLYHIGRLHHGRSPHTLPHTYFGESFISHGKEDELHVVFHNASEKVLNLKLRKFKIITEKDVERWQEKNPVILEESQK